MNFVQEQLIKTTKETTKLDRLQPNLKQLTTAILYPSTVKTKNAELGF